MADFLEDLGHGGGLIRVEAEVDPILEAAEITARVAAGGGPALLFGSVKGHEIPLLTNLLGGESRILRALGASSLEEVAGRIAALARPAEPEGWFDRLKTAPHVAVLGSLPPRRVKAGPCQQVVRLGRDVDLGVLPALQSAPGEAGRAITAAMLVTADPDSHQPAGGRFDLQVLAPARLAVCWAAHDEPARLAAEYRRRNQAMPLAIVLGGDPTVLLAACAPLPPGVDPCTLAGLLRQKPLDTVACRSVDLAVPAEAEIVLEGQIDPAEPPQTAGPLVTPLGHYSVPQPAPVMHVTAITHRANPIFPAVVSTRIASSRRTQLPLRLPRDGAEAPSYELCVTDRALARIFLPLVKLAIPELVDYDLPAFAAARHWLSVSIQKTYAGQARRVANALWGQRQFMFAKMLVVVDEDVDVHDHAAVLAAIAENVHPGRDTFVAQGPSDPFDPAAVPDVLGHRMAIDATAKLPAEHGASQPPRAEMSPVVRQLVDGRWPQYGL